MKNITTLSLLSITLLLGACTKFLDIKPDFLFVAEQGVDSPKALYKTTTGAFNGIQSGNLYGGGLIANTELLADFVETDPISDFSLNQLRTHELNSFNGQAGGVWGDAYRTINIANIILEHADQFEEQQPDTIQLIKAESKFLRGIMHFEMVRLFAQPSGFTADNSHIGIPIRLTPGSDKDGQNIERSSVADVYAQIIQDLKDAEADLPAEAAVRASKYAAQAFLVKAYFQQNDFQNALEWADKLIDEGPFELEDSLLAIYDLQGFDFGTEMIFQSINVELDISNGDLSRFRPNEMYALTGDLLTMMEAGFLTNDERANEVFFNFFDLDWFTKKYNNGEMNVPVVRLAEIYLSRAECKAQLGLPIDEVRDDYNMTRVRAGLPADTTTTEITDLMYIINYERTMELGYEGDRFHELKRRKQIFKTPVGNFWWDNPSLVWPIPQREVDQNENMVQNEGY